MKRFLLALIILLCIFYCSIPVHGQMRIVCIGNSITQGKADKRPDGSFEYSYRPWLWEKLSLEGFNVDMVGYNPYFFGEKQDGVRLNFPNSTGKTFDPDCEAYYGITSAGFLNGSKSTGWTGKPLPAFRQRIMDSKKGYSADFALIHIGTNDADSMPQLVEATKANIISIIQVLRERNANVVVLLAKLITGWKKINSEIESLCNEMSKSYSPVVPVDMTTGFINDPKLEGTMTYDYVHPNTAGQKFMMSRWHEALLQNLNDKVPPRLKSKVHTPSVTQSSITISWDAGSDNYGIRHYEIKKDATTIAVLPGNITTYTINNLVPNSINRLSVMAKDWGNNMSEPISKKIKTKKQRR